ncbi:MAG: hypothetical protein P8M30_08080 [Planctomycetaceae bacterium]|nr:hypothetical protein [Planctomycetaceae bacterium]
MYDLKWTTGLKSVLVVVACVMLSGCQMTSWRQAGFTPGSLAPSQNQSGAPSINLGESSDIIQDGSGQPQTFESQRPVVTPPPENIDQNDPKNLQEMTVPQARRYYIPPLRGPILLGRATYQPFPEGARKFRQPDPIVRQETPRPQVEPLKPQPLPITKAPDPIKIEPKSDSTLTLGEPEELLKPSLDNFDLPPLVSDDELKNPLNIERDESPTVEVEEVAPVLPFIEIPEIEAQIAEQTPEFTVNLPAKMLVGEPTRVEVEVTTPKEKDWNDLGFSLKLGENLIAILEPQTERISVPLIKGGQARKVIIELQAVTSGTHEWELALYDGDRELGWKKLTLKAEPRGLVTQLVGPQQKPVGGRAEYTLQIENVSEEAIGPVGVVLEFDATLVPMEASAGAEQKPGQLVWSFPVLHPGEQILLQAEYECPVATGRTCVSSHVTIDGGPAQSRNTCLQVMESRGTLQVEVLDRDDLTHVGRELTGVVRIKNLGLRPAKKIQVTFDIPEHLSLNQVKAILKEQEVEIEQSGKDQQVVVVLKPALAPDQFVEIEFLLAAEKAGDGLLAVNVIAEGNENPIPASEPFTITP